MPPPTTPEEPPLPRGMWARAKALARRTPADRNRYVDFLRGLSITAVVIGHWLIAAPWVADGELHLDHMLSRASWTRWLTWVFQVMPVFFIVGGYANAASWEAARRQAQPYAAWLSSRLRRLIGPVVPLVLLWAAMAAVAHQAGVRPQIIKVGSQTALVPVWFLAVYVMVVVLVPLTRSAWRAWGVASFWVLALIAAAVDAAAFAGGLAWLRWTNYGFVWLAVHQLGYLWRDGRLQGARALPWAVGGLALLGLLVTRGGYPLSMVGVPGDPVSNTLPPTLAMLALGALQGGLLLGLERPARAWLARTGPWALTIVVNGMIMTIYLWHLTAMALLIGLAHLLGGVGLHLSPGSAAWWSSRPLWMVILCASLAPFLVVFGRFERPSAPPPEPPPTWRAILGASLFCSGLALLALDGIGSSGPLGIRFGVLALTLTGVLLSAAGPRRRAA